jgi:hypothetical protein
LVTDGRTDGRGVRDRLSVYALYRTPKTTRAACFADPTERSRVRPSVLDLAAVHIVNWGNFVVVFVGNFQTACAKWISAH